VEGFNFDTRKHVVEYDDVINKQREIIYARRRRIIESLAWLKKQQNGTALADGDDPEIFDALVHVRELLSGTAQAIAVANSNDHGMDVDDLVKEVEAVLPQDVATTKSLREKLQQVDNPTEAEEVIEQLFASALDARLQNLGQDRFNLLIHLVILSTIDRLWMDHIDVVDDLRTGVRLQAYGQRDPLIEFKNDAFRLFERLMGSIDYEVSHQIFKVDLVEPQALPIMQATKQELETGSVEATLQADALTPQPETGLDPAVISKLTTGIAVSRDGKVAASVPAIDKSKIGRNDPCWCGSGKKYKRCHYPN
jgi:preprotein translocase subunit SecA